MNSKLTLSIDDKIIAKAKEYAQEQGRSLSNIVEEYFKSISNNKSKCEENEFESLVEELCGSVKIPEGKTYDEILGEALIEKYSKR